MIAMINYHYFLLDKQKNLGFYSIYTIQCHLSLQRKKKLSFLGFWYRLEQRIFTRITDKMPTTKNSVVLVVDCISFQGYMHNPSSEQKVFLSSLSIQTELNLADMIPLGLSFCQKLFLIAIFESTLCPFKVASFLKGTQNDTPHTLNHISNKLKK